jgi:energy-coupling factor transporter ATP-binding protein EcfA2
MSYLEPGYHKTGDKPFRFPPEGVDDKIDANLIEIEGRNGTGKTTLLNCLALATGYLDHEKDLETKPALKRKLQDLDQNPTLQYFFRICCDKPEPIDLRIERTKGQKPQCSFNSKAVDLDTINRRFDIIFLTEDDPKKVVNASLGKLSKYFNELEKGLVSIQDLINRNLLDIAEFRDFRKRENGMIKDIEGIDKDITAKRKEHAELTHRLKLLEQKNNVKAKLELLNNEKQINSQYNNLKKKYDQIKDKKGTDLIRSLYKERMALNKVNDEMKRINAGIIQICDSLAHYDISLHSENLLKGDYAELNQLNQTMQPKKREETVKLRMIDDLITLLNRYLENDIVPIINKPVHETLSELLKLKARLAADRVFALLNALNNIMSEKKNAIIEFERIQNKISALTQKSKDLKEIEDIQSAYIKAEEKYLALEVALTENRTKLLSEWRELSLVDGDPVALQNQLHSLDVSIGTQETVKNKYEENLRILRENATAEPKYEDKEKRLRTLYETISKLRENVIQWTQILDNPESANEQFASEEGKAVFGLSDCKKFVRSVGEYLGSQFEPIPFDYRLYNVKFFDIERNVFLTADNRQIHIDNLSQGQSKITSLTGSFRKMDPGKKKIVLIDEISELDPQNLQDVKNTLKTKLDEGSLLIAILVRPSSEMIKIEGWG